MLTIQVDGTHGSAVAGLRECWIQSLASTPKRVWNPDIAQPIPYPMYAGDRSCVTTLSQAKQLCEKIDHPSVGIAVDVYHVWWDDRLEDEIRLLGARGELFAFHLCDGRCPTRDMLNDRALMGDGCIDIATIRRWMCEAGFTGWEEVEIFSHEHWSGDQSAFLKKLVNRYLSLVKI